MMASSSDPEPTAEINVQGDGHAMMPVQSRGQQINNFGVSIDNPEVAVTLIGTDDAELAPGQQVAYTVEVINRGNTRHTLKLTVAGEVPSAVCSFGQDTLVVEPDDHESTDLTVQCFPTMPEGGKRNLKVMATDPSAGPGARWVSATPKEINFLSVPGVDLDSATAAQRLERTNTYRTVVRLVNTGNTRVTGTLRVDPARSGNGAVEPAWFEPVRTINVPVRKEQDVVVEVQYDRPSLLDHEWRVPLCLDTPHETDPTPLREFSLRQQGILTDVIDWCGRSATIKHIHLSVAAAALLIAGALVGSVSSSPSDKPAATGTTAPVTAVATPSISPVTTTPALITAGFYQQMPCATNSYVVFLATITDGGDAQTEKVWNYTVTRAVDIAPDLAKNVKASMWDSVCLEARKEHSGLPDGGQLPKRRVIWLGSFDSRPAADEICRRLHETPASNDCFSRPAWN